MKCIFKINIFCFLFLLQNVFIELSCSGIFLFKQCCRQQPWHTPGVWKDRCPGLLWCSQQPFPPHLQEELSAVLQLHCLKSMYSPGFRGPSPSQGKASTNKENTNRNHCNKTHTRVCDLWALVDFFFQKFRFTNVSIKTSLSFSFSRKGCKVLLCWEASWALQFPWSFP